MVQLMYVITPKAGMNRADFERYWLEVHAPIVKKIPHLKRYVINLFQPRADGPAIGGVAEQWFESLDTMRTAFGTAEAKSARDDIQNFAEVARTIAGLVDEHSVV